jgi:dodecin
VIDYETWASGTRTQYARPWLCERKGDDDARRGEPTYRLTEIVGTSNESIDQAVRNGLSRAGQTLRNLDWFEITQVRGTIVDGGVGNFQVGMKVGFRVED